MIIDTTAKGAQGVTHATIFRGGRHVVDRLTGRCNTMARSTIVHDVGVIEDCVRETLSVMAQSAIVGGIRVGGRGRLTDRINTIIRVVTVLARLCYRVDDRVVEITL